MNEKTAPPWDGISTHQAELIHNAYANGRDQGLRDCLKLLRERGITFQNVIMVRADDGPFANIMLVADWLEQEFRKNE
jgi:hypothetical protein